MSVDIIKIFLDCKNGFDVRNVKDSETLEAIRKLLLKKHIVINNKLIYQTEAGSKAYHDYCEACECNPCDCHWGH